MNIWRVPLIKKALLLVLLMSVLSAGVEAQAPKLKVVASFSILADVVQNVAGDAADVTSLIPADSDPHAYSPTPSDLAKVSDADVLFINGALLEQGILKTIESVLGDKQPVVASACIEILPFGDAAPPTAATPADDPTAQRCDGYDAELAPLHLVVPADAQAQPIAPLGRLYMLTCTANGEDGNCDPHVWFNPYNVALWALQIRDTLSSLDPANAATYQQNAAAYLVSLQGMENDVNAVFNSLAPEKRVLVTDHDALGYFANTYDFKVVGMVVPSVSSVAEASAQQIAGLIDTIRAQHVPAVFAGVTVNPALSQQVADESGAKFYTLYAESLTGGGDAPTYLDFMRYDATTIADALK